MNLLKRGVFSILLGWFTQAPVKTRDPHYPFRLSFKDFTLDSPNMEQQTYSKPNTPSIRAKVLGQSKNTSEELLGLFDRCGMVPTVSGLGTSRKRLTRLLSMAVDCNLILAVSLDGDAHQVQVTIALISPHWLQRMDDWSERFIHQNQRPQPLVRESPTLLAQTVRALNGHNHRYRRGGVLNTRWFRQRDGVTMVGFITDTDALVLGYHLNRGSVYLSPGTADPFRPYQITHIDPLLAHQLGLRTGQAVGDECLHILSVLDRLPEAS